MITLKRDSNLKEKENLQPFVSSNMKRFLGPNGLYSQGEGEQCWREGLSFTGICFFPENGMVPDR